MYMILKYPCVTFIFCKEKFGLLWIYDAIDNNIFVWTIYIYLFQKTVYAYSFLQQ